MNFDQTCIETLLEGREEFISFGYQGSHIPGKVLEFELGPGKLLEFGKSAFCKAPTSSGNHGKSYK